MYVLRVFVFMYANAVKLDICEFDRIQYILCIYEIGAFCAPKTTFKYYVAIAIPLRAQNLSLWLIGGLIYSAE